MVKAQNKPKPSWSWETKLAKLAIRSLWIVLVKKTHLTIPSSIGQKQDGGGGRSGQTCVGCDDESGEDLPLALVEHLREHGVREVKRERQPVHLEQAAGHVLVHLKAGPRFRQSLVNHFVEYWSYQMVNWVVMYLKNLLQQKEKFQSRPSGYLFDLWHSLNVLAVSEFTQSITSPQLAMAREWQTHSIKIIHLEWNSQILFHRISTRNTNPLKEWHLAMQALVPNQLNCKSWP